MANAKADSQGHQQLCQVLRAQLSTRHGITRSSKKEEVIYGAADLTDEVLESISEKEGAIRVDREDGKMDGSSHDVHLCSVLTWPELD